MRGQRGSERPWNVVRHKVAVLIVVVIVIPLETSQAVKPPLIATKIRCELGISPTQAGPAP